MKEALIWILNRLKEKTSWAAILTLVTSVFGVTIAPEQSEAILGAGVAIATAIAVFSTEKPKV